jgi:hypothetical protein
MKSRVIFASLVLGLVLTNSRANAATTINIDDSPAANKPVGTMLVKSSEKQFAQFVEQKANKFTKKADWQNFMSVVSLYNQNPVAVLSLDDDSRTKFKSASAQLTKELAKGTNNADTSRWANQADKTARMINLLWNVETEASKVAETE